jgi:S-adenosyl-L-methionine hydrolase (adenosine-forming)
MSVKPSGTGPIVLLTDFGYRDHYAGVMRGVIATITPRTPIIDLTHGIPPQQVMAGALILAQSWRFFPAHTIFVAVVDPGVGTDRLPIALKTRAGPYFVGPDNGLLSVAAAAAQIKTIVQLKAARYRLPDPSSTFHGRDIFAPAAAWLARGVKLDRLGPRIPSMATLDPQAGVRETDDLLIGNVIYVDGFGNLVTNLTRERVERFAGQRRADKLAVKVGRHPLLKLYGTYGEVPVGAPLALFGSFAMLEVGLRDGNAANYFGADAGTAVTLMRK